MFKQIKKYFLEKIYFFSETEFEKVKEDLYRKAFHDALKDLEETNQCNIEERASELCKERLNQMLSPIDYDHVISLNKQGFIFLGKERATDIQLNNLKAESDFLLQSTIWKILNENPKELAHQAMFVSSETLIDLQKGKSMLYFLDCQRQVINMLQQYTPRK